MVFDEQISLNCKICGTYKSKCCNKKCETRICGKCDTYFNPKKYYFYCINCKNLACTKCFNILNRCNDCNIINCTKCDDGDVDSCDIFYCHTHRHLKVDELYNYLCEKYNESLTLEDIRKVILKID